MNQRDILLAYLRTHGRTSCADLERYCDVRSVTARMGELIRRVEPIQKTKVLEPDSRGKFRLVTYYAMGIVSAQRDLFQAS